MSEEEIKHFKEHGYVVIENVLSEQEVDIVRFKFHSELKEIGIDHQAVLSKKQILESGPRIKSPIAEIFYSSWKLLNVQLHPNVVRATQAIMNATFISKTEHFHHPFQVLSPQLLPYIDRVCYRLPDNVRAEGGLSLHMDRHPTDPFSNISKFRPIQSFVTLTDHFGGETGGLQVVPDFHLQQSYFKDLKLEPSKGEFYRMNSPVHTKLMRKLQTVQAPKGSLVLWDNRLPHATCDKLAGQDTREVIFLSFLPDCQLNRTYFTKQICCMENNCTPPAYGSTKIKPKDWETTDLSQEQKELLKPL